jgi:hypothetical protein
MPAMPGLINTLLQQGAAAIHWTLTVSTVSSLMPISSPNVKFCLSPPIKIQNSKFKIPSSFLYTIHAPY